MEFRGNPLQLYHYFSLLSSFAANAWLITAKNTDSDFFNTYLTMQDIYEFTFKVKACENAMLSFRNEDQDIVDIILGWDTYTTRIIFISEGGATSTHDVSTWNLLDCNVAK